MSLSEQTTDRWPSRAARKPDFFLLGAGRCGSTTLYSMLRQHPGIFMPDLKEPSFFCSYFQLVKDPVSYFQLFSPADDEQLAGEASHVYLSNPESAPVIRTLFPNARFILIFRNPAERAHSLYRWAHRLELEPLDTFEAALDAEESRFRDPEFFDNCPHYFWNYMYVRSSLFHLQWGRYLELFPREQFFALTLNELRRDPKYWMQQVFAFLGVDRGFAPLLEHRNFSPIPPMEEDTRRWLDERFEGVVEKTSELAGRELDLR